jgi:carboxypeptidase C (cathepsin A)
MKRPFFLLAGLFLSLGTVNAQPVPAEKDSSHADAGKKDDAEKKGDQQDKKDEKKEDRKVESKHSVTIGGKKVDYTATAGMISLKDAEDKATADIFYIAYVKDGGDATKRPLTFSFNGGPGSSSVWMHLGLLGPRRVKLNEDGSPVPPPYELVDNEWSLLDDSDLVFIDPVSTGFSRASKPAEAKKFHGLESDVDSVAEFIRLYITRNKRWSSPKFIIGESYGTTRAAALSGELARRHRMNVNGLMLVSTVLNFQTIREAEGNDLPHVMFLPGFTATAWYHKKLPADLQKLPVEQVVKQAEAFAGGEYQAALFKGASLSQAEHKAMAEKLARFTGLDETFVSRANLRVSMQRFAAELLRAERQVVGRFDGRYKGPVRSQIGSSQEYDPSGTAIMSAYGSCMNHYLRAELNYEEDRPYEIIASLGQWDWGADNSFVNVADTLAASMTENPFMKVHVSSGYYDLATPRFATHYTFNHLNIAPDLMKNITHDDYAAGHMMYLNIADLRKQKSDLSAFIKKSVQ